VYVISKVRKKKAKKGKKERSFHITEITECIKNKLAPVVSEMFFFFLLTEKIGLIDDFNSGISISCCLSKRFDNTDNLFITIRFIN